MKGLWTMSRPDFQDIVLSSNEKTSLVSNLFLLILVSYAGCMLCFAMQRMNGFKTLGSYSFDQSHNSSRRLSLSKLYASGTLRAKVTIHNGQLV